MRLKATRIFELANEIARRTEGFFRTHGPAVGNRITNRYVAELGERAPEEFGVDLSEKKIYGTNSMAVDFYIPEEETTVEIALVLRKPNTEFEKDILKTVMAQTLEYSVSYLLFVSKPGAAPRCQQPGRRSIREWALREYSIEVEVRDLEPGSATC